MSNREPEEIYPPRGYVLISAHNTDQLCHHAIFATLGSAREAAQIMQRSTGSDINVAVIGAQHRASWDDERVGRVVHARFWDRDMGSIGGMELKAAKNGHNATLTSGETEHRMLGMCSNFVSFEDDEGRFVGRVTMVSVTEDGATITAVDVSEHLRSCIKWPEMS